MHTRDEQFLQECAQIDPLIEALNEAINARDIVKIHELSNTLMQDYNLIARIELRNYTQSKLPPYDPYDNDALMQCIQNGSINAIRLLISKRPIKTQEQYDTARMQELITLNFHNSIITAFYEACSTGQKGISQYLLDLACAQPLTSINGYDQMLGVAIKYGRFKHFKTLLDNEAHLTFHNRQSLLNYACLHQNKQIIDYLLSKSGIFTACNISDAIITYSPYYKIIVFLLKEYKSEFEKKHLELIFNTSSYYVQTALFHAFPEVLTTELARTTLYLESFAYRHCKTLGTKHPFLLDYDTIATKLLNYAGIKDLEEYDNICFAARGIFAWKLVSKDWSQMRFAMPDLPTDLTNLITPLILGISDYSNILLIRNFDFNSRNEICDPSLTSDYSAKSIRWLEHLNSLKTIKANAIQSQ